MIGLLKGDVDYLKPCWVKPSADDVEQTEGLVTFALTNGPEYHVSQVTFFVDEADRETLAPYASLSGDESYQNSDLEKEQAVKHVYDAKVQPSTLIPKQVGNMYIASLYATFASLLHNKNTSLVGKRVVFIFIWKWFNNYNVLSPPLRKVSIRLTCQTL